jgi:hypothetical protein
VDPTRSRSSAPSLRWICRRRSGSPVDTPQSGRCHAPIKSGRRSSGGGGRHNQCRSDQTSQSAASPGPHRSGQTSPPGAPDVDTEGTNSERSPAIPGNRIQVRTAEASVYANCRDDCHAEGRGFESHQPL